MTSDGHRLRETWSDALNDALATFRGHLTSAQSSSWKRVPTPSRDNSATSGKGKSRALSRPEPRDLSVHRKTTKTGDVYRVILDFPAADEVADLEAWKAVLVTPELSQEWDPAVESARVLEMYDTSTRIVKTKFTLGWPANPRDAVMISRTFNDATTLIDVSTSLPRSPDEPSYLRPAPPYVRSHVHLFAWCMQVLSPESGSKRIRITCFWQHDLKTVWNIGTPVSIPQQLSTMTFGLLDLVKKRQPRIPVLSGYGFGVSIERVAFDTGRDALTVDYAIVPEDPSQTAGSSMHGLDELHALKEQRRLQRSMEILLPSPDGWDIRISTRASSEAVAQLPWATSASKTHNAKIAFQIKHAPLLDDHSVLKVKLVLEFSGVLTGMRLNGLPHSLEDGLDRNPSSFVMSDQLLQDASSAANVSLSTAGASMATADSDASESSSLRKPPLLRTDSGVNAVARGPAFDKNILARVRRNYIYFSSLLQEPEAKWKQNTEVRGVSVTQLDSIDPTLVVYKAEATFVGVGLWDLYSAVVTPGTRAHWDRQYDDATLLEDVNELSELWHFKTKPAWPVTGRDAVVLKTVYKAPTTVHVFAFSIDEAHLFPVIPLSEPGTIRTQVDLQGWAIEALSPTTTQLTLLEQSDPKGWTGKATVPQQMIANVAGIGEFAIRCGGPPVLTRLGGARALSQKYDHERGMFRVEYEAAIERRATPGDSTGPSHGRQNSFDSAQAQGKAGGMIVPQRSENLTSASVECELRCDIDTWANSLDIVIDPPPQSISCLRRHRLSAGGGGLWLTVGHDIAFSSDERLLAIVRRAPFTAGKEKGVVMVNGKRINVDVEELPEAEVKSLVKQKRIKPVRIPLDQPPVLGVIRRRRAERGEGLESTDLSSESGSSSHRKRASISQTAQLSSSAPKVPSPLSNFFTIAIEQVSSTTQQAVAAFSPPIVPAGEAAFPPGKQPMHFALDALSFAQSYHKGSFRDSWMPVADKGLTIQRRLSPEISPSVPVHRAEKVIEGVAAEEVASVIFSYDCRKQWDDRFDSVKVLEEYGADSHTAFLVWKGGFPFRDRGLYIASLLAREDKQAVAEISGLGTGGTPGSSRVSNAIYCVSASFDPNSASSFASAKYNPYVFPTGRVFIDAWVVETLDPYTSENYAIPSTKCTRLVAVDYAGSVPVAFNSMINSTLPRSVLAVETYMKGISPFPEMRTPPAGFLLAGDGSADVGEDVWTFRQDNTGTTLLNSKLVLDGKVFCANVLISFENAFADSPDSLTSEDSDRDRTTPQSTPRPSKSGLVSRTVSPEAIRRPRGDSIISLSPTRQHRRVSSASASATPPGSLALRSRSREPLRTSASVFSIGRDMKGHVPADFVAAEIIIDLRTYPDGYEVQISSRIEAKGDSSQPVFLTRVTEEFPPSSNIGAALPLSHSVHILPPSPLYASSAGVETPVRHLLRLTLPTAQFEIPAVEDPLTGEIRSAPPKPQWYRDLEEKDRHALVRVSVQPLAADKQKKGKKVVLVDGAPVTVGGENEVLKGSANERTADVLSRSQKHEGGDILILPKQLSVPLAVEDSLYDATSAAAGTRSSSASLQNPDDASKSDAKGDQSEGALTESPAPSTPVDEKPDTLPADTDRGFFGFLTSYQNSLSSSLRFVSGVSTPTQIVPKAPGAFPSPAPTPPLGGGDPLSESTSSSPAVPPPSSGLTAASALAVVRSATVPRFSISTLIAAMMIAFLLGSLLRSLLSPADFIYVVTDLGDVPDGVTRAPGGGLGAVEPGWREIKRLVEMKYIVGGWDFQIAVVRRH
ncbi:hypothetical protein M0805_003977 [Coniferiporia weirii]|nr:hypothetical protein M0805_003977 [Coniferiporia weirii]